MTVKSQFFWKLLKIHPTQRKNVFEKLNNICFVTWAVIINPKIQVLISLHRKNIEQMNFWCSLLSANWVETKIMCLQFYVLQTILKKKWELNQKLPIWVRRKSAFSALIHWLRAESALFRDFHVMNSAETELKFFSIRADQCWISLRSQPGLVGLHISLALLLYQFQTNKLFLHAHFVFFYFISFTYFIISRLHYFPFSFHFQCKCPFDIWY